MLVKEFICTNNFKRYHLKGTLIIETKTP